MQVCDILLLVYHIYHFELPEDGVSREVILKKFPTERGLPSMWISSRSGCEADYDGGGRTGVNVRFRYDQFRKAATEINNLLNLKWFEL